MSEYSLGEERDALLDQVDRLEAKVRELEQALQRIANLDPYHRYVGDTAIAAALAALHVADKAVKNG